MLLAGAISVSFLPTHSTEVTQPVPTIQEIITTEALKNGIDPTEALTIAWCESRHRPEIINDNPKTLDYSVGLFQINLYGELRKERPSEGWLLDPVNNSRYAFTLYKERGWKPWENCARKYNLL